jgi:hypothetical protein
VGVIFEGLLKENVSQSRTETHRDCALREWTCPIEFSYCLLFFPQQFDDGIYNKKIGKKRKRFSYFHAFAFGLKNPEKGDTDCYFRVISKIPRRERGLTDGLLVSLFSKFLIIKRKKMCRDQKTIL